MKLSSPKLKMPFFFCLALKDKKILFSGKPLRIFHFSRLFFRCFHFLPLLFRCFHCWLHYRQLYISWLAFAAFFQVICFLCCWAAGATDLAHLALPDVWHNLLLSRPHWESALLPWRLQGVPLRFETHTCAICFFESRSVQQKVLLVRFYLCIKTLQNTILTSSRFQPTL